MKLSKSKRSEILQKRFPEFFRLSQEMKEACQAVLDELEDRMEQIEDIQEKQDEVEAMKMDLMS
jgi:hypothetical protein